MPSHQYHPAQGAMPAAHARMAPAAHAKAMHAAMMKRGAKKAAPKRREPRMTLSRALGQ